MKLSGDGVLAADTTPHLNGYIAERRGDALDELTVLRHSGEGAIQVHYMDPFSTCLYKALCRRQGLPFDCRLYKPRPDARAIDPISRFANPLFGKLLGVDLEDVRGLDAAQLTRSAP